MTTIDCTGKSGFGKRKVKQFVDAIRDDETIRFVFNNETIATTTKQHIVDDIMSCQRYKNMLKDSDIAYYTTDYIELKFNGQTFNWWTATNDRLALFKSFIDNTTIDDKQNEKKEQIKKDDVLTKENQYFIGIATLIDNELSNIHHFKGKKKDCIDFINKDMIERYIDGMMNVKVVINLAFDIDEFNEAFSTDSVEKKNKYKKNLELWYTLEELEEIGAITLK